MYPKRFERSLGTGLWRCCRVHLKSIAWRLTETRVCSNIFVHPRSELTKRQLETKADFNYADEKKKLSLDPLLL